MKVFEPQFRAIINYVILFAIAEVCSGALSCFARSRLSSVLCAAAVVVVVCVRKRIRDRSNKG
jgi:hypothetical protein